MSSCQSPTTIGNGSQASGLVPCSVDHALPDAADAAAWRGRLALGFERCAMRTVMARSEHAGPLRVQRPFYPSGDDTCHVYVLHPPGGIVGGDDLRIEATLDTDACVLLTTPGATKAYRSNGRRARSFQQLTIGPGARLAWLPQECILFDGADIELTTRVDVNERGRFVGWEILCLGRPAAEAPYRTGRCRQRLEIFRGRRPIFIDRATYAGGHASLSATWGAAGQPIVAIMIVSLKPGEADAHDLASLARAAMAGADLPRGDTFSATMTPNVLIARYLGASATRARRAFTAVWQQTAFALAGTMPAAPRIWMT